ncbi:hypothetical protein ACIQU6_34845 [Streptomyces sp. NPDC090442]|uniref:hypothetical protein n=1 Tax=Streptomyces sp. NPDC090442 TaxID=3365962 RepID=UPI00382023B0
MSNSINSKPRPTRTTRRRAMGIRARDERRALAAVRDKSRQGYGDPADWSNDELYVGVGDAW